jgi:pantothenate kinase
MLAACILIIATLASTVESYVSQSSMSANRIQRALGASSSQSPGGGVDRDMMSTYDALAARLIDRYKKEDAAFDILRNNQLFVCVAGGPGSGKSTLSTAVAARINEQLRTGGGGGGDEDPAAVVLPMDGFHYSRSQMKAMEESSSNEGGCTYDELLARRGAPWTFDAEGCVAAFTRARETGVASLPVYCRTKSDPVPDGVRLHRGTKIVLLEGNYLLAWDDERWAPLRTNRVFDETWYISCKSLVDQRDRLVKRHLETWSDEKTKLFGEGALGAGAKADSNDMKNLEWIEEMSRKHADYVIESL